jgi:hypothetical protein
MAGGLGLGTGGKLPETGEQVPGTGGKLPGGDERYLEQMGNLE